MSRLGDVVTVVLTALCRDGDVAENYVDGVSITTTPHGATARNHIWTMAAGVSDNAGFADASLSGCGCPCTSYGSSDLHKLTFLGSELLLTESFYCSTAYHGTTAPPKHWITADALWDKHGALAGPNAGGNGFMECAAVEGPFLCLSASPSASSTPTPSGTATPTPSPSSSHLGPGPAPVNPHGSVAGQSAGNAGAAAGDVAGDNSGAAQASVSTSSDSTSDAFGVSKIAFITGAVAAFVAVVALVAKAVSNARVSALGAAGTALPTVRREDGASAGNGQPIVVDSGVVIQSRAALSV